MAYTPPPGDNIQINLTSGYTSPAGDAIAVDLGGGTPVSEVVESGTEHTWSVYGMVERGVQHIWDVLGPPLESGTEHVWDVLAPVEGGVEHVWRQIVEGGIRHYWHMVPVIERGINHRWSNLPVIESGIRHRWRDLPVLERGIEHSWITYNVVERGIAHVFGVLGPPIERGIEHLWDVKDTTTIERGIQHLWIGGGVGVDQEFAVTVIYGGGELRPREIRRRRSRNLAAHEITLAVPGDPYGIAGSELPLDLYRYSAADRALAIAAARVEIDINGTVVRYLATELRPSVSLESEYQLVVESDLVLLDTNYSALLNREYGPGNASAIAAEIVGPDFTLIWQAVDWWVPGGVLYANNEAPLDVLRKLTRAVGSVIRPGASVDEVRVEPYYRNPVTQWGAAVPDEYLSYGANFFRVSGTPSIRPGYNLYDVSDQLSVSDALRFEERDVRRGLKEIMAYEVPWTGALPALETSGPRASDGGWIVIEAGELVEETILGEEVEIVQGAGQTQKPIYAMIDRDYGSNTQLGAISYGEDGAIETEIEGQSLCLIDYKTRYWRWLVADPKDERVQLYSWPVWADAPVTLVVTFGDVTASQGFVVAEPDDERNVDAEGNTKTELAPDDPFYFLAQHDATVRIESVRVSDGTVSFGGMVSREKEQQLAFADGSGIELPYIPAGGVAVEWYGRNSGVRVDDRKVTPDSWPAIGEASYGAVMRSYTLQPPMLALGPEEKHYILIVINVVSV